MKKISLMIAAGLGAMFLVSCAHVPTADEVAPEVTYDEIIVLAQREFDKNNYRGAKAYYQIMIDRFGTDMNVLNIGEFEIAHILLKQKKYAQAKALLEQILARFAGTGSALLKPEYKKLAEIDLKKITEKTHSTESDESDVE